MPGGAACLRRGVLPSAPTSGEVGAGAGKSSHPPPWQGREGGQLPAVGKGNPCPSSGARRAVHDPGQRRTLVQSRGWRNQLLQSGAAQELRPTVEGVLTTHGEADTLPALAQHHPHHGRHPSLAQAADPPGLHCRNLAALPAPAPRYAGGGPGLPLLQKAGGPPPAPACRPHAAGPSPGGAGTVTLVQRDIRDVPAGPAKLRAE